MKRIAIAVALLATLFCSCSEPESCSRLEKGSSYEITLIEKWDENSSFAFFDRYSEHFPPCNVQDVDLGARVITIDDGELRSRNQCYDPICPNDFPVPSNAEAQSPAVMRRGQVECYNDERLVTFGSCTVSRYVALERVNFDQQVFDEPEPGKRPPLILVRGFGWHDSPELKCDDKSAVFPDDAVQRDSLGEPWGHQCVDSWVVTVRKK